MSTIVTTMEERDALDEAARATPCKYVDCSRTGHEFNVPVSEWSHEVAEASFDGGIVRASIFDCSGQLEGGIEFAGEGTMTAAEFREAADDYEAFPAWLRSMADRMDSLDAQSWIDSHPDHGNELVSDLIRATSEPVRGLIFAHLAQVQA